MRRAIPFAILAGCLGVGVLPALAADTTVSAGASSWDPSRFAVKPGEQVTWRNKSGVIHNLTVDGSHVQDDGSAWTYGPQAYAARATAYEYHCSLHPGMSGRFYVNESGTVPAPSSTPNPPPDPSPTPPAYPTPTPSPAPAGGGGPGGTTPPTGGPAAERVSSFRASPPSGASARAAARPARGPASSSASPSAPPRRCAYAGRCDAAPSACAPSRSACGRARGACACQARAWSPAATH